MSQKREREIWAPCPTEPGLGRPILVSVILTKGAGDCVLGALVAIMKFAYLLFPLKRHEVFVLVVLDVHL